MPQPNSNSARFFGHDYDMRNDIKIRALRRQYGHTGYAVWCFILETLTGSDNFEIEYNDLTKELLANDFDTDPDTLTGIVDFCCKVNLLQVRDDRLFSEAHKRRFQAIDEQRERRSEAGRRNIAKRWNKQADRPNNGGIADDSSAITSNNGGIADDSKEKKSKGKEIKEKKKKEDNVTIPRRK